MPRRPRSRTTEGGVRVGCSGWNYPWWRSAFYPPGLPARDWLAFYAERFDTVEVNTTFYRLVRRDTAERWVSQTPPGFSFAVKVSRYLTHIRRLREIEAGIALLLERIEPLVRAGRLGVLLWQLPENFHRDDARLSDALDALPADIRHAFEFRHPSWFEPEVYSLLRDHGAALVVADAPGRPCELVEPSVGWRYVRLHHGRRGRRGNYSQRELADWARRLDAWGRREDAYVYFNNDWEAFAPANALTLERQLAELRGGLSDRSPRAAPPRAVRAGRPATARSSPRRARASR